MRKLTCSAAARCAAFLLAVLFLLIGIGCTLGVSYMADHDFYTKDEAGLTRMFQYDRMISLADHIFYATLFDTEGAAGTWQPEFSNIRFTVTLNGLSWENTYHEEKAELQYQVAFPLNERLIEDAEYLTSQNGFTRFAREYGAAADRAVLSVLDDAESAAFTVTVYLLENKAVQDSFTRIGQLVQLGYSMRFAAIGLGAVGYLLGLLCVLFLFFAVGHRTADDMITLTPFDRVPLDLAIALLTVLGAAVVYVCALIADSCFGQRDRIILGVVGDFFCCCALLSLILALLLTVAVRIKAGHPLRNTLCRRILHGLHRLLCRIGRWLRRLLRDLPLMWKTLLLLAAIAFFDLAVIGEICWLGETAVLLFLFIEGLMLTPLILTAVSNQRRLQRSLRRMAKGELDTVTDTAGMLGDYRRAAEDLNSIRDGMAAAVEERLKSERLKTELITNVSHDIKTPLTSIVNYVDLIKKQQPQDETLRQYVDVLDRQSERLKKLIGDLIEASKASSGVLAVHPEPCSLGVLLEQAVGEYTEKLTAAGLTPVTELPDAPVTVLADGRHLWRIFDNLLNNACKYGMPGTRLYLTVTADGERAAVTFRNISREELNVSAEELTERFVRGDRSRHSEGSGLGLSIARSLAELQGGSLQLLVDGDLFKVILRLPRHG